MPLPSSAIFNELSGDEAKHVLEERFHALLSRISYLQKHITLPRLRLKLLIQLEMYADSSAPEKLLIDDDFTIVSDREPESAPATIELTDTVDASPSPAGKSPDEIREQHNLPVAVPYVDRDSRGQKIATVDKIEGAVVDSPFGRIDRTGQHEKMRGGTVVEQDFGPAHLAKGGMRNRVDVGNQQREGGFKPPPPVIRKDT